MGLFETTFSFRWVLLYTIFTRLLGWRAFHYTCCAVRENKNTTSLTHAGKGLQRTATTPLSGSQIMETVPSFGALITGLYLHSVLYGMYIMTLSKCCRALLGGDRPRNFILLISSVIVFGTSTAWFILNFCLLVMGRDTTDEGGLSCLSDNSRCQVTPQMNAVME